MKVILFQIASSKLGCGREGGGWLCDGFSFLYMRIFFHGDVKGGGFEGLRKSEDF